MPTQLPPPPLPRLVLPAELPPQPPPPPPAPPAPVPPPPPPPWTLNLGVGFTLTRGNTDTRTIQASVKAVHLSGRHTFQLTGQFLRNEKDGQRITDRLQAGLRDDWSLSDRAFLLGTLDHLRDPFQGISSQESLSLGAGRRLVLREDLKLSVAAGLGGLTRTAADRSRTTTGAYELKQNLDWKLSPTTQVSQTLSGLWKANETGDAQYQAELALDLAVMRRLKLRISAVDLYRTRPLAPATHRNDLSTVMSLVFTFP